MKSISFYTLGCRLNQSETASIQNSFDAHGYRVVDFEDPADIVVINTCTVTENGDADTRRLVNKINRLNPNSKIALIGCQAQVQKEKLTELKNVRWVVGNARKMELAEILNEFSDPLTAQVITPAIPRENFTIAVNGIDRQHTRANIKIQDGCDFFCSFCEIPYARGRARSRQFDDILLEARALNAAGHKEIVLTGINIGTYQDSGKTILDVITALEKMEGLDRIRISSIEPTTIPAELINMMCGPSKLCRYLHIPLQSGSDEILTAMKRKYLTEEFQKFIATARRNVPEICIGTDAIVGFPGESDRHFEETYNFLLEAPIDYFHVFSYSPRYLAKSKDLDAEIPSHTIAQRSQRLRELSQRKRRIFNESLLNTIQIVLVEEQKNGFWIGLTDNYARVKIRADHSSDLTNQFFRVRLTQVDGPHLRGEIIAP